MKKLNMFVIVSKKYLKNGYKINRFLNKWIEQYLFFPNIFQRLISVSLFPFTILYCIVVAYKRTKAVPINFGIDVISIGNLVVGGSGKTPVTIALAKDMKNVAVVLRGYGRNSKGMFVVASKGKILEDVQTSGDEAQLLALKLPQATIIVSENRVEGILKAKELGAKTVFLDDGYSHHNIKKFDILIRPKEEPTNLFCLPSGGYRETKMMYSFAPVVLRDGTDFTRNVVFSKDGETIEELPSNIIIVSGISKPSRLLEYLPHNIKTEFFIDHHNFTENDMTNLINKYPDTQFIVTAKDFVKISKFNLTNIILMDLEVKINKEIKYKF